MPTNFPTGLDDNSSLYEVVDGVTEILDEHHNNPKDAIIAIERKVGIFNTSVPTALDTRLGHPTVGHSHNGASGQGPVISPTVLPLAATGIASYLGGGLLSVPSPAILRATGIASIVSQSAATVLMHVPSAAILRATGIASIVSQSAATAVIFVPSAAIPRYIAQLMQVGSIGVGSKISAPVILGRTMQLESVQAGLRVGPSGATTGLIVRFGASHIYGASPGFGLSFAPGATAYRSAATPNVITYPSGVVITLDATEAGSNDPGQDTHITFIFRE